MASENVQHRSLRMSRRGEMLEPEEVDRMIDLHRLGWGINRIDHGAQLAQRVSRRYSLFKADVAEHRSLEAWLPLIVLVRVVRG